MRDACEHNTLYVCLCEYTLYTCMKLNKKIMLHHWKAKQRSLSEAYERFSIM